MLVSDSVLGNYSIGDLKGTETHVVPCPIGAAWPWCWCLMASAAASGERCLARGPQPLCADTYQRGGHPELRGLDGAIRGPGQFNGVGKS